MKKTIYFISTTFFLFSILNACIPIKKAKTINTYELKQPTSKKQKKAKSYIRYAFSNYGSTQQFITFLNTKYKTTRVAYDISYSHPIIKDLEEVFTVRVAFSSDSDESISFLNLLIKDDDKDKITIEKGEKKFFVSIRISDSLSQDSLAEKSFYRYILIDYLNELKAAYNAFKKNIIYIEPEHTKIKN